MKLKFKHLSNRAKTQIRVTAFSASYEIFLAQKLELKITIDVALKITQKYYCWIAPRSRWVLKIVVVGTGAVDPDSRGNIGVVLYNDS